MNSWHHTGRRGAQAPPRIRICRDLVGCLVSQASHYTGKQSLGELRAGRRKCRTECGDPSYHQMHRVARGADKEADSHACD
jgi:hypothetical protein